MANISNALLGNTPGVSGLQTSGEPGHNDASIRIRGISTYGSANPLIVIDGVEQPSEQAMAETIRHDQRSFSGTESLSTYIYDDYDLWKFRNNRDYTPVELLDARGDLTAAQKELLKNQPALYYASRDLYKGKCSIGWLRRCRST